ncbi:MAG: hypothetical protein HYY55_01440 [Candidatus Niyogibacteria bacterium]|nr:MAG: hypothetical protein HYY55_01440 [Candidatus Niyogibacteria bacterium]
MSAKHVVVAKTWVVIDVINQFLHAFWLNRVIDGDIIYEYTSPDENEVIARVEAYNASEGWEMCISILLSQIPGGWEPKEIEILGVGIAYDDPLASLRFRKFTVQRRWQTQEFIRHGITGNKKRSEFTFLPVIQ